MELFERIRIDHRKEGLSVRALARRHNVHRRTVRQALASALPPPRATPPRPAPKLDPVPAATALGIALRPLDETLAQSLALASAA